jgi:hypothetical protein
MKVNLNIEVDDDFNTHHAINSVLDAMTESYSVTEYERALVFSILCQIARIMPTVYEVIEHNNRDVVLRDIVTREFHIKSWDDITVIEPEPEGNTLGRMKAIIKL